MPRPISAKPKYRLHKPSGQAVVTFNGRDQYLGKHGTAASKATYVRLCREYKLAGGALIRRSRDQLEIVQLLDAFRRHAEAHYGPDNRETANYATLIRRLRKAYGKTLVCEFGPLRLKAFRELLVGEELSRTTVNHSINRVRRIFNWGVENELVGPEVHAALKCVKGLRFGRCGAVETEPVKPVADVWVDATIKYCSPHVAAMIDLQRVTGMRSGEVCQMRTCDISTQGSVWTYTPAKHKTMYRGHSRVVYLGPRAQAILRPWLRTDLEGCLFQPSEAEAWRREQQRLARKTPLSCGNRPGTNRKRRPRKQPGTGYTPSSYGNAIEYAIKKGNLARAASGLNAIPHWHAHQLRHAAATNYRREYGLEVARVLLGHKSVLVTQVYAEADQTRAIEVMAKIG